MNTSLLRRAVDHIKAHPEDWDQERFLPWPTSCGTRYCIAGHIVVLSGEFSGEFPAWLVNGWSREDSVCQVARNLLGISNREAVRLFDASRTIADFELVIERCSILDVLPEAPGELETLCEHGWDR